MTLTEGTTMPALRSPIQQFYAGQNVLITGGTGFLGKMLIEKLLRGCPDLSAIYIIVRPKKGQDAHQRFEKIFDEPLFDVLKKEQPKFQHKITVIPGDCSLPGLGLSTSDRELLLREITIIFNVAATVRFDEKLKQAVAINIQGPREIMELSKNLPNLKAVIHVSTAYSNCNKIDIEEKFYEPPMTGDNAIKLIQILDDNKLNAITQTLLGDFPNTYTYTKCIAEQVILQYGKNLPVGIFRPAIVVSAFKEPLIGWIDNVFGPTGALAGGGAGLIRTLPVNSSHTVELVPADLVINALISTAWDVAINKNADAEPPIYNYHSSWTNPLTWGRYIDLSFKHGKKMPSIRSVWCYSITATKNALLHYLLAFFLHILPAFFVDAALVISGKQARVLKIYKKIHKYLAVTAYFSTKKWNFHNGNTVALWERLSPEDKENFFFSMKDFDWEEYMQACIVGLRTYIFKESPDNIPQARKRMARLVLLHRTLKYILIGLSLWALYVVLSYVLSISGGARYSVFSESITVR